ncbi:hypothetical protein [Corynebacterium freneyi]|uniref:Uncharacterized protein n=1 Tax=Corynebacterium freneyi DNF00450 TaxID=1287475 RepID=A0A095Y5T6_9CORY|nr:hypothetical protein [Corynebacterium freneyi]KGF17391.1 hypothetical protein HMPREF1650_04330 [Corynebacterium freneyi DNF00450]
MKREVITENDLAMAYAVGVMARPRPPRWWTITKIAILTIIACAVVLWIGHQADQHLAAALDAGWGR